MSEVPSVEVLLGGAVALLGVVAVLLGVLLVRSARPARALRQALEELAQGDERIQRALREELAKHREESSGSGRHLREEVAGSIKGLADSLVRAGGEAALAQKHQLDSFALQLLALTDSNEKRLGELRGVVDARLQQLHEESGKKLDAMRATVDEKLQGTLEKRLGEAFKQVSERLEAVHQGLGDMQNLAAGVGDLKRVLSNVKTRGTWGEIQLGELLAQILTPEQYEAQVAIRRNGGERVDYAVRMPGQEGDDGDPCWLPIDAKFPQEDYQRLQDAQERADAEAAHEAGRQLEQRIRSEARSIRDKYVRPPLTTDFAILFLPTESLYAEVLRRPGLSEWLMNECRVVVAGPTNLAALLSSLRMGFRTLAIERRSSEVRRLLGAVKEQFGAFSGLLDKVQGKLRQASDTLERASSRSRSIEKRLKAVEELPAGEADLVLPELAEGVPADPDADEDLPGRD